MLINRRDFLKLGAAGIVIGAFPGIAIASNEIIRKKGQRVVIVGGGFGGAVCREKLKLSI